MSARFVLRPGVLVTAGCIFVGGWFPTLGGQLPPKESRTPNQRAKFTERDRLLTEVKKLQAAGKLPEAIAAAEKSLAIERDVFGPVHPNVAD
jgi:hypothetical protein